MNSIENLKWRYACKKFNPERKLDEDQMEALKKAFVLTATSYGLQPVRLIVVKDAAIKNKMVEISYGQAQPRDASHVLVLCTTTVNSAYIEKYFEHTMKLRGTPAAVLQPFKDKLITEFTDKSDLDNLNWARNQAYIAMGNLLNVCAAMHIDSCPMEGFIPEKMDALLGLDKYNLKSTLLLPVGHRADDDLFASMKKVRFDKSEMILEL